MRTKDTNHITLTRRHLLLSGAMAGAALLAPGARTVGYGAQDLAATSADDLLDLMTDSQDTNMGIDALIEVFTRSGIAVYDDVGEQQLNTPATPVSPLAFMRWQLGPLVAELSSGISRPAAEYDAMFPTETEEGDAVPTVGELIAGYYDGAETPGAEFTRAYLNRIITDNLLIEAHELPAPTVIVALLGGEMLGQFQEATAISPVVRSRNAAVHHPAAMAFVSTSGAPVFASQAGVCGAVQSFISNVTSRIFEVLEAAEAVRDIPIIGGIFSAIVRGVRMGLSLIMRAVDALLAPVLGIVRAIGAAISVASTVVGTLSPWTATMDLRPAQTRFGVDAEVITGEVGIIAGGWDLVSIPDAIRECASFAGVPLPEPTAANAPVHIQASQPRPLVVFGSTELRLDTNGEATASYVTETETAEQARGDAVTGIAWITAVVEREDLMRLRDQLFSVLFQQLPGFIADIIQPIVGPLAADLTNKLIALVHVSTRQPLFVTYHESREEEEEDASAGTFDNEGAGDGCFPGFFLMSDPAVIQRQFLPFPIEVDGSNMWYFHEDGTIEIAFFDLLIVVELDPSFAFDFLFNGSQYGTYTTTNGVLSVEITVNELVVTSSAGGQVDGGFLGPSATAFPLSGPYVCGDPLVWTVQVPEVGPVNYEFIRT